MRKHTITLLACLSAVVASALVQANVTNITSGGPEHPTFAAAIAAAAQGDILRGRAAVWNETAVVPMHKDVRIYGGYNADYSSKIAGAYSVVTNEASSPVFQIMLGAKVYLHSLIIKGGDGTGLGAGGVLAQSATAIVVNCVVTNCASQRGAGLNSAGLIIASNTQVVGNHATKAGGGVYVRSGSAFVGHNVVIRGNTSDNEGGGVYAEAGDVSLSAATVAQNTAINAAGGGLYAESGVVARIVSSLVATNVAATHGGGLFATNADVTVLDSVVLHNEATNSGGGLCFQSGSAVVSNTTVSGNVAVFNMGGGVVASHGAVARVDDAQIGSVALPNVALSAGAGLMALNAEVRLRNVVFEGNTGEWTFGGGAYINSPSPVWMSNVVVRYNTAYWAGGVSVNANEGLEAYHLQVISNGAQLDAGVTIYVLSNLYIDTLHAVGNTSEDGIAGLSLTMWACTGRIYHARFVQNRSNDGYGGGWLYGNGDLLWVSDLVVTDNDGDADNDDEGWTGGLEVEGLNAHIQPAAAPVEISRNKGGRLGGVKIAGGTVRFHAPSASLPVIIAENTAVATSGVGAVYCEAGLLGGTAAFYGAVHVISNRGYHGGIVVTNDLFYWLTNQAYFVAVPSNGNAAQIAYNRSEGPGGGLYVYGEGTAARLHSARLLNNFAGFFPGGGGAAVADKGEARFINAHIVGNFSSNFAGGVAVQGQNTRVYFDADFASATSSHLPPTRIVDNYAHLSGGGVAVLPNAELYLYNTLVASNRAANAMAGGLLVQASTAEVRNAVIARNIAGMQGDGVAVFSSPQFSVVNSTIADNETNGLYVLNTPMSFIQNTIVWGHGGLGYEFNELMYTSTLQHCTVQGGYPGTLVLTNDPQFLNAASLDYQLSPGSPCINTGMGSIVSTDCIGTPRPQLAVYDIGAYEFVPEPAGVIVLAAAALFLRRRA